MQGYLIGALIIAIITLIFGLQNLNEVTIHFLWWKFKGSLALILLLSFTSGVLASILASLPTFFRKKRYIRQLKKQSKKSSSRSSTSKEADSSDSTAKK